MKRRDFLKNIAYAGAGALLLPGFLLPQAAEAAEPFAGLTVRRTYLRFGALRERARTDAVVVHHIGASTDADVAAGTVHRWHLANGWAGIGYHFLIRKDGTIEQGRPMGMVGAHCEGENEHTVGISIAGNFEQGVPRPAQMESATRLVNAICLRYGIRPAADTILGHRDLCSTDCPGRHLYMEMPELVAGAAYLYGDGPDWAMPEQPPEPDTRSERDRLHGAYSRNTERNSRNRRERP